MQKPTLSVLVCTHNPRADYFNATLEALEHQVALNTGDSWELIVIDNASSPALENRNELNFPKRARIIKEPVVGLTHARRRSFAESAAAILVYVDDDNILEPHYLLRALEFMRARPDIGGIGGRVLPRFESPPPPWLEKTGITLACRDLGSEPIEASWTDETVSDRTYPDCAPIGAGMVLRREAYGHYITQTTDDAVRLALGRRGSDLASGEDNDMVMTILEQGWGVAYLPDLVMDHFIPSGRTKLDYLKRYAYASNRTWVQVLHVHGICPWRPISPLSAKLRKFRSAIRTRPWSGPVEAIAYSGARGLIDGRALIT